MTTTATRLPVATPPAPETAGSSSRLRRTVVLGLLVSAQFLVMLDASIVNVTLASIQKDLGFSATQVTWVVNAYVVTFGGLLLLSGRVADLFGRRRTFVAGSLVFTVGTLLAAVSVDQATLIAGRIIQGAGAAALSPAAMSLLLLSFPGEARAKAMSVWGAASTVGGATGVVSGGLIAGSLGWRWVFLVTVPVSLVAFLMAHRALPEAPSGPRRPFDWRGAVVSTGFVVVLVHGALGAAERGWTSPYVLACLAGSATLMATFVVLERGAADPLVPLALFSSATLSRGVALAVTGGAARASSFVLIALYLQQALAMAPQQAGLGMLPTSLTGFVVSLTVLRRVLRRLGPERSMVLGLVVLAAGQLWLGFGPGGQHYLVAVLPGLFLVATGVALSFTPTTMVVAAAVPTTHAGLASGLAGSASQVGSALGTACFVAVGLAVGGHADSTLDGHGFSTAFAAAAVVSLASAALAATLTTRNPAI
jgi:EmrB/QacA subfamily drug resistance transporter